MTQYICDRCKAIELTNSGMTKFEVPREYDRSSWPTRYDLCENCVRELRVFLVGAEKRLEENKRRVGV